MERWRYRNVCAAFALVFLWLAACATVVVFHVELADWRPRLVPMALLAAVLATYALTYMAICLTDGGYAEE